MRSSDKDDGPPPDALAILDAVIEHVAEEEAENGESTEQDIRWSRDVRRKMQFRIAALRRQLTQVEPIGQPALLQGEGTHQDLASLSDEDLRRIFARLTVPTKGGTP